MKFKVIESKWLRGARAPQSNQPQSMLRNQYGEMCCMGFFGEACGIPKETLESRCYFSSVVIEPYDNLIPEALRPRPFVNDTRAHGQLAGTIYLVNDDTAIGDDERKERLTALFAEAGVEVEFVP